MRVGDWIEFYDAPATRGIVTAKEGVDLLVLVHGETGVRTIGNEELQRYWEVLHTEEGASTPPWVRAGAVFIPRDVEFQNTARIYEVRPGWVAYLDFYPPGRSTIEPPPTFMMTRWSAFREKWTPEKKRTSWSRLLEEELD